MERAIADARTALSADAPEQEQEPDPSTGDPTTGFTLADLDNAARMREALLSIAFPGKDGLTEMAANPARWPSMVAYVALGGRIEGGKRLNNHHELAALSGAPAQKTEDLQRLWRMQETIKYYANPDIRHKPPTCDGKINLINQSFFRICHFVNVLLFSQQTNHHLFFYSLQV